MKNFLQYIVEADNNEMKLKEITDILTSFGYKWERTSTSGFIIKVYSKNMGERYKDVQKIKNAISSAEDTSKADRLGKDLVIKNTKIQLRFKPQNKGGVKSAGLTNEHTFINNVNKLCKINGSPTGITIVFKGKNGVTFTCRNVVGATGVGTAISGRRKADVILNTAPGCKPIQGYPISLKQENAEMWESGDTLLGATAKKKLEYALAHNLTELKEIPTKPGVFSLSKAVCFPAGRFTRTVMFGSDILGYGCIIQKTFAPIEFKDNANGDEWYEITVPYVFTSPADVKKDEKHAPWIIIRNDSDRNSKILGYPGIRVLCVMKKLIDSRKSKVIINN